MKHNKQILLRGEANILGEIFKVKIHLASLT